MYMDRIKHYFDIRKSFVKYGAYHRNETNKWIHIICVPIIYAATMPLVNWIKLFQIGSYTVTGADVATAFYASTFFAMDSVAALLYMPAFACMWYAGKYFFDFNPLYAVAAQVICWTLQFIGHGVIEKRRPALLDNLPESMHAAVFFVWLEVLFMLGYKPNLHKELNALVEVEAAKLKAQDAVSSVAKKLK